MTKGNRCLALALVACLCACASNTEQPAPAMAVDAGTPPLITRMRALEAEVGSFAVKKAWSAQLTGDSIVDRAWLEGTTLLLEAYNATSREFEVFSVDTTKGRANWMVVLGMHRLERAPHVGNGTIAFITETDGGMIVVDSRTGSRLFNRVVKLGVVPSTDAVSSGATMYCGNYLTDRLAAVSSVDGGKGWDIVTPGLVSTSPILTRSLANQLVICGTNKGSVFAVAARAFDDVPPTSLDWSRQFSAPVSANLCQTIIGEADLKTTLVVVPCEDKNLYGLDAANGRSKWVLRTNSPFKSDAAAAGGFVFARNGERFFCVDAKTGERAWWPETAKNAPEYEKTQLFGNVQGFEDVDRVLAVAGDRTYLGKGPRTVIVANTKDGGITTSANLVNFDFVLTNGASGHLIAGTRDGIFMAFE